MGLYASTYRLWWMAVVEENSSQKATEKEPYAQQLLGRKWQGWSYLVLLGVSNVATLHFSVLTIGKFMCNIA